jgi:lincosamide nucleotidyltransferase A/C/D/E
MTEDDVIEILDLLARAGIRVWVDGGWGVDALIGEQTRSHSDLDLAIDHDVLARAQAAIGGEGFRHDRASEPGLPGRLVLRDRRGREVDFHPLKAGEGGDRWQQLSESGKAWGWYSAEGMNATGLIRGRKVRCLSPALQLRFRMGYEWTERDEHDIRMLVEHFGLPKPPISCDSAS